MNDCGLTRVISACKNGDKNSMVRMVFIDLLDLGCVDEMWCT